MHEISIARAVVATAERHADGRPVTLVSVRVGRMRQVVPATLRFAFGVCARDTACAGARLELTEVEVGLRCARCGLGWEPQIPAFRCPGCGSADVSVEAGDELVVEEIEVEVEEAACTAPG
jgi:hydrogenase nickel incorporation protein HypA/HybF